jgi:hypothetical protein
MRLILWNIVNHIFREGRANGRLQGSPVCLWERRVSVTKDRLYSENRKQGRLSGTRKELKSMKKQNDNRENYKIVYNSKSSSMKGKINWSHNPKVNQVVLVTAWQCSYKIIPNFLPSLNPVKGNVVTVTVPVWQASFTEERHWITSHILENYSKIPLWERACVWDWATLETWKPGRITAWDSML